MTRSTFALRAVVAALSILGIEGSEGRGSAVAGSGQDPAAASGPKGSRQQDDGSGPGDPAVSEADRRWLQNQFQRIEVARRQLSHQRAANMAEKIVARFPDLLRGWTLLAEIHLHPDWTSRNDSRAEIAEERAIELGGRQPMLLFGLATVKFRQRRVPEALSLIAELVDTEAGRSLPPGAIADLLVSRASMRRESADPDEQALAGADLDRALALLPKHGRALLERAEMRSLAGEHAAALADLKVARPLIPGAKELHFLLFKCYKALGRNEEAKQSQRIYRCLHRLTDSQAARTAPGPEERLELLRELWTLNPLDLVRDQQRVDLEIEQHNLDVAEQAIAELRARVPNWPPLAGLIERLERARAGKPLDDDEEEDGDG